MLAIGAEVKLNALLKLVGICRSWAGGKGLRRIEAAIYKSSSLQPSSGAWNLSTIQCMPKSYEFCTLDLLGTARLAGDSKSFLGQDRTILLRLLAPAFGSPATLDSLGLRLVDVVRRNPTFIISFRARGNCRSIGSHDGDLISGVDFLRLARRLLSTLAAFSSATLLWEEGADPSAINEVACASKGSTEE